MITITGALSNDALQGQRVPPQSLNHFTVTLFSGLPFKDFPSGLMRRYPKNTIVINQGDPISSLYFILSGRIKLYMSNQRGKAFILDIRGPGDYFGDLELGGCRSLHSLGGDFRGVVDVCHSRYLF